MNTLSKVKNTAYGLLDYLKKQELSEDEKVATLKLAKKLIRNKEHAVQANYETR